MFATFTKQIQQIRLGFASLWPHHSEYDDGYYDEDDPNTTVLTVPAKRHASVTIEQTEDEEILEEEVVYTTGRGDRFKEKSIEMAGAYGSYVIAIILGYGNGFFFADFRSFDLFHPDWWVWMSYLAGFLLEFIAINILFKSSKHWYDRKYRAFAGTFAIVLVFALGTIVTQYLMMQHQLVSQHIVITDDMVNQVPLLGLVVGVAGLHGSVGFLVFRAALFHLGEVACVFLVPTRKPDIKETIRVQVEESRERAALKQQQHLNNLQDTFTNLMDTMMATVVENMQETARSTTVSSPVRNTVVIPEPRPVVRQSPPIHQQRVQTQIVQPLVQHEPDDITLSVIHTKEEEDADDTSPKPLILSKEKPSGTPPLRSMPRRVASE